jgi:ketosteroid isomerase-like protein
MKTFPFLASVLILVAGVTISARSQSKTPSTADVIIAAEHAWAHAAVVRDIDTFSKYMSDDYVLIVVNTKPNKASEFELTTKPQWVETIRTGREKYDSVDVHDFKVLVNGDIATVTGQYSQKGTKDGKDNSSSGLYVDTWILRKGQWRLVSSVFP